MAKKVSKPKAAPKEKAAASPKSNNLMQAKHDEDRLAKAQRKNNETFEQKIQQQVRKCLKDNFSTLSEEEQRHVYVDNIGREAGK